MAEQRSSTRARIPASTYRLQFNRRFTFAQAAALVDYFAALGVGDIYSSPILTARPEKWPHGLSATSTHDTKRGEDVRARINALSEIPGAWGSAIKRWAELNRPHKTEVYGELAPDANEEYLLYQTLVGAWPLGEMDEGSRGEFAGRIQEYMNKALKEAKLHTSWISPNEKYDSAVREFVSALLSPQPRN